MSNWYDDKSKVKDVFDFLRNYGICGLVFYAGTYFIIESGRSAISSIYLCSGICFIVLSIYLFYVNTRVLNRLFREWAPRSRIKAALVLAIPAVISMLGVFLLTHSAFEIEMKNGQTLGATKPIELIIDGQADERSRASGKQ